MTEETGNRHSRVVETINRAIDLNTKNQTGLAVQILTDLVAEFPRAASIHAYLALFLSRGGRLNEAIEHSREAVQLSQSSEKTSLIFFSLLWTAGQHAQALDEMKRFLTFKPSEEYANILKEWEPSIGGQAPDRVLRIVDEVRHAIRGRIEKGKGYL